MPQAPQHRPSFRLKQSSGWIPTQFFLELRYPASKGIEDLRKS